jgi:small basic protein
VKATVWRDKENWKLQQYSSFVLGKFVPRFVANLLVLKFACACDSLLCLLQLQKNFRSIDTIYSQVFVVSFFLWIVLWKLLVVQGKGLGEK